MPAKREKRIGNSWYARRFCHEETGDGRLRVCVCVLSKYKAITYKNGRDSLIYFDVSTGFCNLNPF